MAAPKLWYDRCWVTITPKGGSNLELAAKTKDITINYGDKDIELIDVNSGQIAKFNRREMVEITFDDVIPLYGDVWNAGYEAADVSGTEGTISASLERKQFRIVILWTDADPSTISSATDAIPAGTNARRLIIEDAYFTSWEENWRDLVLMGGATFKAVAVDETGTAKVKVEYCTDASATGLSALSSY